MVINQSYSFKIISTDKLNNITIIESTKGDSHTLKGITDKSIGKKISLKVTNKRGNKYFFSQEISDNTRYELNRLYALKVIELNDRFIALKSSLNNNDETFFVKNTLSKFKKIITGDYLRCKTNYIMDNNIEFYIIGYDYENQFSKNEYNEFEINTIEKNDNNESLSYLHVNLGLETLRLSAPEWLLHVSNIGCTIEHKKFPNFLYLI
jgi:hypothetical protein